jgi:putative SOS response-associated peptidase YedK
MCGRITQHRDRIEYLRAIGWNVDDFGRLPDGREPSWNVAPGTQPWILHRLDSDRPGIATVHWGYRPSWAAGKGLPLAINARLEKGHTGAFFRPLWRSGRILVPTDGYFEWTGPAGRKTPWFIHAGDGQPKFFAALTDWRPDAEIRPDGGFAILTTAAAGDLAAIHDRRPVAFAPAEAELWLDRATPPELAEQLARTAALPPEAFAWHRVSTTVNKAGNHGPHLVAPIAEDDANG